MVLDKVSFDVRDGEFLSIVGPSGCGKTTLLRIVDGLVGCDYGEVILNGHAVSKPGPDRGFVFQSDGLLPWRTVLENVAFGLEAQGVPRKERRERAGELLGMVGLASFHNAYPHQLSGGMRQRVNLARALAINPDVLLMDEPFAALDAQTRELMQNELLRIWAKHRKTVIFITHQIDEAVYLSDRVLVLSARPGRVIREIQVEVPRPRPLSVKRTLPCLKYIDDIWELLSEQVHRDSEARSETEAVV
jgi:NitT/TauT family transport system ATP-binding protein